MVAGVPSAGGNRELCRPRNENIKLFEDLLNKTKTGRKGKIIYSVIIDPKV